MSRWFRHYAGMMRDDKLVGVALRAKQPVERVMWVWGAILETAAEINDAGRYRLDAAEVAYFLRTDEADIAAILAALTSAGRLADGIVVNWGDRQFQSDKSAPRQAAYRQRKRQARGDGDNQQGDGEVTPPSPPGDAPEADTESKTKTEQPAKGARADRHVVDAKVEIVRIFEAAGYLPPDTGRVEVWDAQKYDLKLCVAVIRERVRPGKSVGNLAFFDNAIREAHEKRNPTPTVAKPIAWDSIVTIWAKGKAINDPFWPPRLGAEPGEAGCRCPPEILRAHGVDPETGKLIQPQAA